MIVTFSEQSKSKETSLPVVGKGGHLFSGNKPGCLMFDIASYRIMRHCVLSNLLDEERHTGRRRPGAGVVNRDEGDRVIASLGNVDDGSITGSGMV